MAKKVSTEKIASKIKGAKSRARIEDLAESIITKFGGLEKFAESYVEDFKAAKMGSVTRARLLDGALKLLQFCGKKDQPTSIEDFTDDELQAEIKEHFSELVQSMKIEDLTMDDLPISEAPADGTPP